MMCFILNLLLTPPTPPFPVKKWWPIIEIPVLCYAVSEGVHVFASKGVQPILLSITHQNFLCFWCHWISFLKHFFVGFSLGWKILSILCLTDLKYNWSCSEIAFPLSLSFRCNSNFYLLLVIYTVSCCFVHIEYWSYINVINNVEMKI